MNVMGRKMTALYFLIANCLLWSPAAKGSTESSAYWTAMWANCHDVHTPGFDSRIEDFKSYLKQANSWEQDVEKEKVELDHIINKTCVAWAADPNGSTHLQEFRKRYGDASAKAIAISDKANGYLLPTLKSWTALQIEECSKYITFPDEEKLSWSLFPCSESFTSAENRIQKLVVEVSEKFNQIKEKCPIAADHLDVKQVESSVGQGAPEKGKLKNTTKENAGKGESDISGTRKAIEADKKASEIIRKK